MRVQLCGFALLLTSSRVCSRSISSTASLLSLSGGDAGGGDAGGGDPQFVKLSESTAYDGKYRQMKNMSYRFPNNKIVDFDILTQGGQGSVVVFCFDRIKKTATLIREFHPGAARMQFGAIAGMYERLKHKSALECAQMELEEEAHLRSENWIPLIEEGKSMSFEKYSDNHFYPYLVLDPIHVPNPKPLDAEEYIIIEKEVPVKRIMELITSCQMNVVSSYCVLLALKKLDELGIEY